MFLFNFHNSFKFKRKIYSDFKLFEISVWIHSFGKLLISVFIPIILLELGYSVGEVVLYLFIYYLFDVPLNFLAKWLTAKMGARNVIILGTVFYIIFFLGIYKLTLGNWLLLSLMAFLAALYDAFYWVAHIYYFMQASKSDDNVGGDVSFMYIARMIPQLVAPLIGAAILIFSDKGNLIFFSIIMLFISVIPLFYLKDSLDKPKKVMRYRDFFSDWESVKDYLYSGFYTIHASLEYYMWPMFIFIVFESIESVAFLPAIISLTTIIFAYFSGRIKKGNRYQSIVVGSFFLALIWIVRIFVEESWVYFVSVFLVSLFSMLVSIPLDSNIFEKGEKKDALLASFGRNTSHMIAGVFVFGFLALVINIFQVGFITASLGMFFLILLIFMNSAFGSRNINMNKGK